MLRGRGLRVPVLLLAGAGAEGEADVVRGLDAGANDYVARPLRPGELLARLRAQLRAFDDSEDAVFAVGPYLFRPAARLLTEPASGRRLRLTAKEAAILGRLHRAGGGPVPRRELLAEVWGRGSGMGIQALEVHVGRLRRKVEPDPSRPRLLLTERGAYRLEHAPAGRRPDRPRGGTAGADRADGRTRPGRPGGRRRPRRATPGMALST